MKKFFVAIIFAVISCVFFAAFAGCSDRISSITDIERFSDMQCQADKIKVDFDNGTQAGFPFTVTDKDEVTAIMDLIFNTPLNYGGKLKEIPPLGNTVLTVYQGEKTYTLGKYFIAEGENYYSFSTNELAVQIDLIAEKYGAFDFEIKGQ